MTKSLVINCSLDKRSKIPELLDAIEKYSEYTVVGFRDILGDFEVGRDVDTIVLSGSAARIMYQNDRNRFTGIINLIKQIDLPLFSICFGHQLLCWSLGARVASHAATIKEFEEVRVLDCDEIFVGFEKGQTLPLAQSHNDYVVKDSLQEADLVLLADSESCEVEAIRHQHKPLYGVQFHPERIKINYETHYEGLKIIANFYSNVVKR